MDNREQALDKVKKLLRMATDGRGNEHEAAAAARQAEAIMRKWQIDAADALMSEIEKDEAFCSGFEDVNPDSRGGHKFTQAPSWTGFVGVGCAWAFDVRFSLVRTPEGLKARFQGFESDVAVAQWTYRFLSETVWRLSNDYGGGRAERFAFRQGAAARLQERLKQIRDARKSELQALPHEKGTALALYDRKAERVAEMFGELKVKNKSLTKREPDVHLALKAGKEAGDRIALNRVLEGTPKKSLH